MKRRDFTGLAVIVAALPSSALAQRADRERVVGYLTLSAKPAMRDQVFEKRLRELGWVEGKNLRLEVRRAGGIERLAGMAQELARMKVDVLVAVATPVTPRPLLDEESPYTPKLSAEVSIASPRIAVAPSTACELMASMAVPDVAAMPPRAARSAAPLPLDELFTRLSA